MVCEEADWICGGCNRKEKEELERVERWTKEQGNGRGRVRARRVKCR
jgi:hypothetical protein